MLLKLAYLALAVQCSTAITFLSEEYECPHGKLVTDTATCYAYVHKTVSISEARQECAKIGYGLALIPNELFNHYSHNLGISFLGMTYGFFYIGLSGQTGKWKWDNGKLLDYKNWAQGNNYEKKCVVLRVSDGKWVTKDCDERFQAMCTRPATSTMSTTKKPAPTPIPQPCREGFYFNKKNNMCYTFYPQFEHLNLTNYLECVLGSTIESEDEAQFVRGILKYFNPQLIGCRFSKDRHYFIGRISNLKEGVRLYTTCKNAEYCSKDDNVCKINWKKGPNYVFPNLGTNAKSRQCRPYLDHDEDWIQNGELNLCSFEAD